ncbi:hypothetical protein WS90_22390 [Burkholderia cepacia]|uniref:Uncharacterized protein n=1 Tax=Burkholderia cepacia TaxID=292 RepID=A0A124SMC9_BURCE|nr:hypothetical protein WS90_22390 [Burkholderia cepacia]
MVVDPSTILAARDVLHPPLILQVPLNGLADTGIKGFSGLPAEFAFEFASVDCVTAIMARSILYIADLGRIRLAVIARLQLIEDRADRMHNFDVPFLVPATNVISLAERTIGENGANCRAVIFDVEPVTNLLAIAIDRQRLARERIQDDQRNQLLGKMVWTIVV